MNKTEMIINKEIIIALTSCYDPEINIELGCRYYSMCLKKSKKQGWKNYIANANRMYNQGLHGKKWRYKNWKHYAYPIVRKYNKVKNDYHASL